MQQAGPIRIQHFSDILCVWAYASEVRVDELAANFQGELRFEFRYFPVFGHVPAKMERQWADRGGLQGYADHVREVAAKFDHLELHPDAWEHVTPVSSLPAHLLLAAARVLDRDAGTHKLDALARNLRKAFFTEARDISQRGELLLIAEQSGLAVAEVEHICDSGVAFAELHADISLAQEKHVTASPTLLFNEDRQRLTGNVGYRVMEANVRELLRNPADQQSWC
jgi:predicted DsbA family dithiol-disulfide isomerase